MNFHIGQKVICIDDQPKEVGKIFVRDGYHLCVSPDMSGLKKGAVYTVSGFKDCWDCGGPGLLLVEIKRHNFLVGDIPFKADRFRPLVENKTSTGIAILNAILKDAENFKVKEKI